MLIVNSNPRVRACKKRTAVIPGNYHVFPLHQPAQAGCRHARSLCLVAGCLKEAVFVKVHTVSALLLRAKGHQKGIFHLDPSIHSSGSGCGRAHLDLRPSPGHHSQPFCHMYISTWERQGTPCRRRSQEKGRFLPQFIPFPVQSNSEPTLGLCRQECACP